jgi:hypothetical protein
MPIVDGIPLSINAKKAIETGVSMAFLAFILRGLKKIKMNF